MLDEADRLLHEDFEKELDAILQVLPKERQTFLFSATMTSKVAVRVLGLTVGAGAEAAACVACQPSQDRSGQEVEMALACELTARRYSTVDTLVQQYVFVPHLHKDVYLTYVVNELAGSSVIIFTCTCANTQKVCGGGVRGFYALRLPSC